MNRAGTCAVALVALMGAACGEGGGSGNSGDTTTTTAASTTTSRPAPTEAEARAALLTSADLPSGWQFDDDDSEEDSDDDVCPAFSRIRAIKPAATAEASFARGQSGPFVEHTVDLHADEATAQRVMQTVDEAVRECNRFSKSDPTLGSVEGTFALGTTPNLGDASVAASFRATSEVVEIAGELIVVRDGRAVSVVTHLGIGSRLESALTTELARKAAAKLEAAA